jgi:hypothetical protein
MKQLNRILRLKDHRIVVIVRISNGNEVVCRRIKVGFWEKDNSRLETNMEKHGDEFIIKMDDVKSYFILAKHQTKTILSTIFRILTGVCLVS